MNKIQSCLIQVERTACISDRVNGVECDASVFFTVVLFCSLMEFDPSRTVFDRSLKELTAS